MRATQKKNQGCIYVYCSSSKSVFLFCAARNSRDLILKFYTHTHYIFEFYTYTHIHHTLRPAGSPKCPARQRQQNACTLFLYSSHIAFGIVLIISIWVCVPRNNSSFSQSVLECMVRSESEEFFTRLSWNTIFTKKSFTMEKLDVYITSFYSPLCAGVFSRFLYLLQITICALFKWRIATLIWCLSDLWFFYGVHWIYCKLDIFFLKCGVYTRGWFYPKMVSSCYFKEVSICRLSYNQELWSRIKTTILSICRLKVATHDSSIYRLCSQDVPSSPHWRMHAIVTSVRTWD